MIIGIGVGGIERGTRGTLVVRQARGSSGVDAYGGDVGIQIDIDLHLGSSHRRTDVVLQAQIGQGTGVESYLVGSHLHWRKYLQTLAGVIGEITVTIQTKGAVTREITPLLIFHHEKTLPGDGQIGVVVGVFNVTLAEQLADIGRAHAATVGDGGNGTIGGNIDIDELRPRTLVTIGGRVGNIVAGHFQVRGCGLEATQSDTKRHNATPPKQET